MLANVLRVIIILLAIVAIYYASSANKKMIRLRKRYDYLLRGRGDLNLEELILQYSNEMEDLEEQLEAANNLLKQLESRVSEGEDQRRSIFDKEFSSFIQEISSRVDMVDKDLNAKIRSVDEMTYAKLDELERTANNQFQEAKEDSKIRLDAYAQRNDVRVKRIEEDNFVRFDEVDKRMQQMREEQTQQNKDLDSKIQNDLKTNLILIKDQLSFCLQKVFLYRYDAFSDLSGEQSFSLVLLDEHNSGIIFTSIYSRQGASLFAKKILESKPKNSLSPEETYALDKALKQD